MTLRLERTILHSNESERVWHVSWSMDGTFFATAGEDRIIKIWAPPQNSFSSEVISYQCISKLEDAQSRTIRSCEWSPDGNFIASASFDGTVVIWEAHDISKTSWDQVASIEGHESEVKSVSWNYSGSFLATCGRDKKVWVWEKLGDSEFECVCVLDGHTQDVKFVCWHPREDILLSGSYDDTIKVWGAQHDDWFCIETITGHSSTVWGMAFSPDGSRFISCSDDRSLKLWESDHSGKLAGSGPFRLSATLSNLHEFPVYSCHWSAIHGFIATGGGDNSITLCRSDKSCANSDILCVEQRITDAHAGDVNCVRWNPSENLGHILVSVGDEGTIKLWSLEL